MLSNKIQSFPIEIQYKIMSYSYSPQSHHLCQDIKNYFETINYLRIYYRNIYIEEWGEELPEDQYWLVNDVLGFMNDYYPIFLGYRHHFCEIINRSQVYRNWSNKRFENVVDTFIKKLNNSNVTRHINVIWGLLLPEERNYFIHSSIKNIDLIGEDLMEEEEEEEEDWDF
jgi:hypothetical protein